MFQGVFKVYGIHGGFSSQIHACRPCNVDQDTTAYSSKHRRERNALKPPDEGNQLKEGVFEPLLDFCDGSWKSLFLGVALGGGILRFP